MLKLFLDANTIVSGLLFEGNESTLLEFGRLELCKLMTNEYVLVEVKKTLCNEYFRLNEDDIENLLGYLLGCVTIIKDPSVIEVHKFFHRLNDKIDIPILVGAINSDCKYLVTGDSELLKQKFFKAIKTRKAIEEIIGK